MPVKAEWFTPEGDVVAGDPFADAEDIEKVGTLVELGAEGADAELNRRLIESVHREGELAEQGVTCPIKDAADTSCHACPLFRADDSPMARLCLLGREQERTCTQLVARRHGG